MLEAVADSTGIDRRPDETPREYLRRVCEAVGCDEAQTATVIDTAEAALFGPEDPTEAHRETVLATLTAAQEASAKPSPTPAEDEPEEPATEAIDEAEEAEAPEEPDATPDTPEVETDTTSPESTTDADTTDLADHFASGTDTLSSLADRDPPDAFSEARGRETKRVGRLHRLLAFLPALALVALVVRPIPTQVAAAREIGVAAQAMAFAEDGVGAYTYLTVQELPHSLHLGSWLASPLVALGLVEGPRLVGGLAAVATALVLFGLARRLWAPVTAVLAVAVLWANPYWLRFAWAATPEQLAIFLTTAAIAVTVRYADSDPTTDPRLGATGTADRLRQTLGNADPLGLGLLVLFLGFAVLQTAIAAVAVVPVVALLGARDRAAGAIGTLLSASIALGILALVGSLQPAVPTRALSMLETGLDVYASEAYLAFWADHLTLEPYPLAHGLHFVGSAVVGVAWLARWRSTDADHALLMGTWLIAGLAVPLALPGGALVGRTDFLWVTAVPLSLSVAVALGTAVERLAWRRTVEAARVAAGALVVVLVLAAVANALVIEAGVLTADGGGIQAAVSTTPVDTAPGAAEGVGTELADRGVPRASDVVFVGDWHSGPRVYRGGAAQVLLYGGLLPTGTWTLGPDHVRVVDSMEDAHPCAVAVVRDATGGLRIQDC